MKQMVDARAWQRSPLRCSRRLPLRVVAPWWGCRRRRRCNYHHTSISKKVDENGNYIGGSEWKLTVTERGSEYDKFLESCYSGMELVVTDNDSEVSREELVVETVGNRFGGTPEEKEYLDALGHLLDFRENCLWTIRAEDLDPEPGKIHISNIIFRTDRTYELSEINPPEGFDSGAEGPASITFRPRNP